MATWYNYFLQDLDDLILPKIAGDSNHVFHLYVIRSKKRDALQHYLLFHGIGTAIHYPVPPHLQTAFLNLQFEKVDFSLIEEIDDTCLSLPLWPGMMEEEVSRVCKSINGFFQN